MFTNDGGTTPVKLLSLKLKSSNEIIPERSGKGPVREFPWSQISVNEVMFCKIERVPFSLELLFWPLSHKDRIVDPEKFRGNSPSK
jgi:hypothetical protein